MATIDLKSLMAKLNPPCRQALEGAAGLCLSRTNYNVEVEHWLVKLLEAPGTDLVAAFRHFGVDASRLLADLTRAIDALKTGNSRSPILSPQTVDLAREAWLLASVNHGFTQVRTGHLLLALLSDASLERLARAASREFQKITAEALVADLSKIMAASGEAASSQAATGGGASTPGAGPVAGQSPALNQYTIDLTQAARNGSLDPILGRDVEIRQVVDILTRRRQNNPILTGEAGVGKTAVVEGFAQRIAAGDVPPALQNVTVRVLDLGLLQAGAGVRGEFENRLKSVIEEVQKSPTPVILFIDEAHTLIGAGGQAGQGDAANLLKPALARGELRTIAATTWSEYKQYFESDAALSRRFQVVKVDEPTEETALIMMRGIVGVLREHHGVEILDEAVEQAVRLSKRYISGRQLPDKSVSLLDTACARVAIGQSALPAAVEDAQRRIEQLQTATGILEREAATDGGHVEALRLLAEQSAAAESLLAELRTRWDREKKLVHQIREFRGRLAPPWISKKKAAAEKEKAPAQPPLTDAEREQMRADLARLTKELREVQGEDPLLQPCVDGQAIAAVVSDWTGIPVGRMVSDEIRTVLTLKDQMEGRVVGQSHALEAIARRIRTARANLTDPRRPIGVFLLVGPSGVGKTETGITLAELLYGGEQNMTVINMSEFKEEHKVSLLMGAPPGYVGYGKGGVLTEAVRRRPYSVVLLDEMEKAHPGVQDIFYQVFDKGMLRDGEGRDIDFKNTVILMTSNAATDAIMKMCADPETMPDSEALARALHPELLKTFKPAFLGRVTTVPYFPLTDPILRQIVELQLRRIAQRVQEHFHAEFVCSPELIDSITKRCTEVESGARNIDRILTGSLLPEMSAEVLSRMAENIPLKRIAVELTPEGNFHYLLS